VTKIPDLSAPRKRWLITLVGFSLILLALVGWNASRRLAVIQPSATQPSASTLPVQEIPISGPAASANAEISGMAWYKDWLTLLVQYPNRFGNQLFVLSRTDINNFLDGVSKKNLIPVTVPVNLSGLGDHISGFEGFESISFQDDYVYLTVEAHEGPDMLGYVVRGKVLHDSEPFTLDIDFATLQKIEPQADLSNFSDEALTIFQGKIYTFYEANGANVNPQPRAHIFSTDLVPDSTTAFPTIEYRITDATATDADGYFWAINYLFPGDLGKLKPAEDLLSEDPNSHISGPVERLIAFQITAEGIIQDQSREPLNLVLLPNGEARNWEAIERLDGRGFLLATDTYPTTILAFVAVENP